MATTPKNRIVRQVAPKSMFESCTALISSAISWNQGDMIYFDSANYLLKPMASDANGATFVGIARQTIVSGKLKPVYQGTDVDAAVAIEDVAGPQVGVIARYQLKVGDTFTPGCQVYWGGDAQTISSVGVNLIGNYQGSTIVAVAGDEGDALLRNYAAI